MNYRRGFPALPRRLVYTSAALLILATVPLAGACGGSSEDRAPAPTATLTESNSVKDPTPAAPGTAVLVPTSTPGVSDGVNREPFVFQSTIDGVTLNGHLYSIDGPKRKVVILAHGENETQNDWQPLAQELAQRGIAAVTFDFRGTGESQGSKDASKHTDDLEVAVRYLQSMDWPLIYIVGSDSGGIAALKVGARQELAGVATISSVIQIPGLDATPDIAQVVEPKLFLAGSGDSIGSIGAIAIGELASEPKMTRILEGTSLRGIDLLQVENARQSLLKFIGDQ